VVSLGLLIWAFLPLMEDYAQAGLVLVVVNLVAVGLTLSRAAMVRGITACPKGYNVTPADGLEIWRQRWPSLRSSPPQIRRRGQWGMLSLRSPLFLGHVLHLLMASAGPRAGWVRLAELCAYPVLAGLMMRRAAEPEEPARAVPTQSTTTPWTVIETCQRVADSPTSRWPAARWRRNQYVLNAMFSHGLVGDRGQQHSRAARSAGPASLPAAAHRSTSTRRGRSKSASLASRGDHGRHRPG